MAYDVTNFEEDVLQASHVRPVVVDFWAAWCGPCRTLGPVLEKLASEQSDRWTLAKVNTEEFQDVSMQYGIRGIPAVKLFVNGKIVDEFTGALPESAVRQWLEKAVPGEMKELLSAAENFLSAGQTEAAAEILERILAGEPTNPKAAGLLARCVAFTDSDRATVLAKTAIAGDAGFSVIFNALETLQSYRERIHTDTPFPDEPGRDDFIRALTALSENRLEEVIMALVEVIKINRYFDDDSARKIGVAVFLLLGEKHALTLSYRRTFDMWLT